MSCVVAVKELKISCELIEVSWSKNINVDELNRLNALGTVPTLVLNDGKVLTQNTAVLEYLTEVVAKNGDLLPAPGSWDRFNVLRWLAFAAADFHKAFTVSFRAEDMATEPVSHREIEEFAKKDILNYLAHLDRSLERSRFIAGDLFSIADCYLVVVLGWCSWIEIDLAKFVQVARYFEETCARAGVKSALDLQ